MLIWHGHEAMKTLLADARRKVRTACLMVEADVKASMKKGGRVESGEMEWQGYIGRAGDERRRRVEVGTGKRAERINSYRSKEGDVPRVQTGRLKGSITTDMHETMPIGRVGTNVIYGKWLEFGIPGGKKIVAKGKMLRWASGGKVHFAKSVIQGAIKPRPFMRPSLMRMQAAIVAMFGRPITGTLGHS